MKKNIFTKLKIKKTFLFLAFVLIITSGFSCTINPFANKTEILKPVKLTVWGVYEERDALQILFDKFTKEHPTVTFEYKKFTPQEYENQLLEAWAEDRGPDIYFLQNNSLLKYKTKITPMPDSVILPYRVIKTSGIGSFQKKDVKDSVKKITVTSKNDLTLKYPEVVSSDIVIENKIYGLPLSVETLALLYNRDILNKSNIPNPPKTWVEFMDQVKKITRVSKDGTFIQSGTALGTTNNISNSADIVALLLMQSDIKTDKKIDFESNKKALISAIKFYNDFSNTIKETYSWNEKQIDSFEAFKNGQVAFFFGYPYNLTQIKNLNFGVVMIPQLKYGILPNGDSSPINPTNFANYWVMTVSHKTTNSDIAWGFIDFATKKENAKLYLEKSKKPTALKDLITEQANDLQISPFVNQILSARSWYHGANPDLAKKYLNEMISQIKNAGSDKDLNAIIQTYQSKINQTIK